MVLATLEAALRHGAIVPHDPEMTQDGLGDLARYRISNWLAARYKLPVVAGKSRNLTTILSAKSISRHSEQQGLLFDE